jgi:hypothetical protein
MAAVLADAESACRAVAASVEADNQGKDIEAFGAYWQRWDRFFREASDSCLALASALEEYAGAIELGRRAIEQIADGAVVVSVGEVLTVVVLGVSEAAAASAASGMVAAAAEVGGALMAAVEGIAGSLVLDAGALANAVRAARVQASRIQAIQQQRHVTWQGYAGSAGIAAPRCTVGPGPAASAGLISARLLPALADLSPTLGRQPRMVDGMPDLARSGLGRMVDGGSAPPAAHQVTGGQLDPAGVVKAAALGGLAGGAVGGLARLSARAPTRAFAAAAKRVDQRGRLTNGTYTVGGSAMAKHLPSTGVEGHSQFLVTADPETVVLDAARQADQYGLWAGDRAKVFVPNGPIGVEARSGQPTSWINLYRRGPGFVHGAPGRPPDG